MTVGAGPDPSDPSRGSWRRSRRSMATNNNCVEVLVEENAVFVRDSKDRSGPVLSFTPAQWKSLLSMIRNDARAER